MHSVRRLTASSVVTVRRLGYAAQRKWPHSGQQVATGIRVLACVGRGRRRVRAMTHLLGAFLTLFYECSPPKFASLVFFGDCTLMIGDQPPHQEPTIELEQPMEKNRNAKSHVRAVLNGVLDCDEAIQRQLDDNYRGRLETPSLKIVHVALCYFNRGQLRPVSRLAGRPFDGCRNRQRIRPGTVRSVVERPGT